MQIKVLKFGGTSLIDDERRLAAIQHIMNEQQKGYKTVVVVSAIGRKGMP